VVEHDEDFLPAFDAALGSGGPAIVEVRVDPAAVSPAWSLKEGRLQAAAGREAS
jgi:thiamine pyrophosphate-dependent acetolactate synthase large subunit-like protein